MEKSKTIKIFLISSDELANDRNAFGNLVRRLDKIYEKRGIRIELFDKEDYDAAYNNLRKQDEYNDQIKVSDMFIALFHTKAGKFTIEKFNVATEEFRRKATPKVYTYCKDLQPDEVESPDLTEFKHHLFEEMGHYWSRYANRDTMQLHFVMQLQLVETTNREALIVENGEVKFGETVVAQMDNLPFAAKNDGYQRMKTELEVLTDEIEMFRSVVNAHPDEQKYKDQLQKKLDHYNTLRKEFSDHQQALFDAARRISEMQLERVSSELRKAIEEFEQGHVEAANAILDIIEHEAERHVEQMERDHVIVHQDIEALLLKTKTLMADNNKPINTRIAEVEATYKKADEWAEKSVFPKEKYAKLLLDYGDFLYKFGQYDKALNIWLRNKQIFEDLYGDNHPDTATSNHNIGLICYLKGDYNQALKYHLKALEIRKKLLGINHPHTLNSYNSIGVVCTDKGNYDLALEYHLKALEIKKKLYGNMNHYTSISYYNIGVVYYHKEDYKRAFDYYVKDMAICIMVLGEEHPDTAKSYIGIGNLFYSQGKYDCALGYFRRALEIQEKVVGTQHPDTAGSYYIIGRVLDEKGDHDKEAMEYYQKALDIWRIKLGESHPYTKTLRKNIEDMKKNKQ